MSGRDAGPIRDTPRLVADGLSGAVAGPFSFHLNAGDGLLLHGPSGVGKSVLLRMLADLDPHRGRVTLDGVAREAIPAPLWRRRVAYVPAEPGWWAETAAAHFAEPPDPRLGAALDVAPELFDRPLTRLSTGERQRLALMRALVMAPTVLLLDEPTAALDPARTSAVAAVVSAFVDDGGSLVLVSHDPAERARLGYRQALVTATGLVETASS